MWFVRTKNYDYLAGVLLAVTGCEAMFANLGQFNKASTQIGFSFFVYPMLVLAYLGQGARLIKDGDSVISNVFYNTIPGGRGGGLYWIVFIMAILASKSTLWLLLIASQATITASFSLCQQLINLKSLPPLKMIYTSETVQGQVYFPVINYTLAIGTIAIVGGFKNLGNLTNAYGFAVATVMIVTTSLVAIQMYYTKHLPWPLAITFFFMFGFFDGLFWGASLKKIPKGAWVTLMIGSVLCLFMLFWTWGKGLEDEFDGANRRNLRHFIGVDSSGEAREKQVRKRLNASVLQPGRDTSALTYVGASSTMKDVDSMKEDEEEEKELPTQDSLYLIHEDDAHPRMPLPRLPTCAVFHKLTAGRGVPHTFYGFLRQWPALPRVVIFLSVRTMNINHVPREERYNVTKVRTIQGFYGVTYALGFRDDFSMKIDEIIDKICLLESRVGANDESEANQTIHEIYEAVKQSTHIIPHYHVISAPVRFTGLFGKFVYKTRKLLIEGLYRRIEVMFPETGNWVGSADQIIRVGINAEI
ncbi:hypothetical protein FRB93_004595 [Tulasnella sp. JGI-2019a]|nr:hypothetical protein FRB93_004595 [Tulasnella sp. JGI-2019a]